MDALLIEIRDTFFELNHTVGSFDPARFNTVPFPGSWTPGQVADHIIRFASGLPDATTAPANRPFDEKVDMLRQIFLDYSQKFETPDFIAPGAGPFELLAVLEAFDQAQDNLLAKVRAGNLEVLCMGLEVPVFGYLTRYEWIRFILVHIERHVHQLKLMQV